MAGHSTPREFSSSSYWQGGEGKRGALVTRHGALGERATKQLCPPGTTSLIALGEGKQSQD